MNDLVSDYKLGGLRIIDEFKKSREQALEMYQTEISALKEKLTKTYEGARQELAVPLYDPRLRADVAMAEENHHKIIGQKLEQAFALCEEGWNGET